MKVAIHQPQYLPWTPYFTKIREVDVFVLLDDVAFQKNGFQNRNKIMTRDGARWLTVPVLQSLGQPINNVVVDERVDWRRKHCATLRQNYAKFTAEDDFLESVIDIVTNSGPSLSLLCEELILLQMQRMAINTRVVRSSWLATSGASNEKLIQICKAVGANTYVSGTGAKDYMDKRLFEANGISVVYQESKIPKEYQQRNNRELFCSGVSALDLILNCGDDWYKYA